MAPECQQAASTVRSVGFTLLPYHFDLRKQHGGAQINTVILFFSFQ